MNCVNHPQTAASAYCRDCGKALCGTCAHNVKGVIYCEDCLAKRVQPFTHIADQVHESVSSAFQQAVPPQPGVTYNPNAPHPALALWLGFIPGVGAMYCGEFAKAVIHVLVFAALIAAADKAVFFAILICFWYFFMVFDCYQTAKAKQLGQPVPDYFGFGIGGGTTPPPAAVAADLPSPSGLQPRTVSRTPIAAVVLIGIGVLFMLDNIGWLHFHWFDRLWPFIFIVIGTYMFVRKRERARCHCARCTANCIMGPAILVTLGVIFLLDEFTRLGFEWPLFLIVIGLVMFLRSNASTAGHIAAGSGVTQPQDVTQGSR